MRAEEKYLSIDEPAVSWRCWGMAETASSRRR